MYRSCLVTNNVSQEARTHVIVRSFLSDGSTSVQENEILGDKLVVELGDGVNMVKDNCVLCDDNDILNCSEDFNI